VRLAVQQARDNARAALDDEIRALELRRAFEREALRELSLNRVELAANVIFERVTAHADH
jgi:hypothetical protein